ncbi:MAG: ABC transporter permease [Acidobacteria bacterium]|nr:ABC transporter permease [Acidobacteriota bacterium]
MDQLADVHEPNSREAAGAAMTANVSLGQAPAGAFPRTKPVEVRHIRLQPTQGWAAINLYELWEFRDLLLILAGRDVRLRFKQTALGVIWVILQPLLASGIFAVIFGYLAKLPSDGKPYLLFVYSAMLPWNFFAASLQRAGNSLIGESRLISKVYFPRMIMPISSSAAVLVDFAVSLTVMVVLMLAYRVQPTWNLLALAALIPVMLLTTTGVSLFLSALNVYYRDFMYALPFILQVWMYGSPLVYSVTIIPEEWRLLYALNPMVGVIEGFRWAVLGGQAVPIVPMGMAGVLGCWFFFAGAMVFRRVERYFADVI